jgi:hypothetical protein
MEKAEGLPIFVCLLALSSCQKCKDCNCAQTVSQTGMLDFLQTVDLGELCGDDLEDVEDTITFTQTGAGFEQSIEQTCDCY